MPLFDKLELLLVQFQSEKEEFGVLGCCENEIADQESSMYSTLGLKLLGLCLYKYANYLCRLIVFAFGPAASADFTMLAMQRLPNLDNACSCCVKFSGGHATHPAGGPCLQWCLLCVCVKEAGGAGVGGGTGVWGGGGEELNKPL